MFRSPFCLLGIVLLTTSAQAATVVMNDTASSKRVYYAWSTTSSGNLSDAATDPDTLIYSGPDEGRPITPAVYGDTLYWSTYYPGQIRRSDLDGNNVETVVDQGDTTTRAIEFHGGYVYWSNESLGGIYRSLPDFQTVETVISGHTGYNGGIWDFAIYGDRFYWASWDSSQIRTTALDGSDFHTINVGAQRAFSIEAANGRLYISDTGSDRIFSTALDGSDVQTLISGVNATGMEIYGDRLYFNDDTRDISSIALAGGTPVWEATADRSPFQFTVVPEPSTLILLGMAVLGLAAGSRRLRPAS